jgi:hypothetical protein
METQPEDREVGLCGSCRNARLVRSDRGSIFYQCKLAATDPHYPQYPRLPVLHCSGYKAGAASVPA